MFSGVSRAGKILIDKVEEFEPCFCLVFDKADAELTAGFNDIAVMDDHAEHRYFDAGILLCSPARCLYGPYHALAVTSRNNTDDFHFCVLSAKILTIL